MLLHTAAASVINSPLFSADIEQTEEWGGGEVVMEQREEME